MTNAAEPLIAHETGDAEKSGVLLSFRDISLSKEGGRKQPTKEILKGVSGVCRPGALLAIVGPSGAGKTSLLNVLANKLPVGAGFQLSGSMSVEGYGATHLSPSHVKRAFVPQEDVFYPQLTVRETLRTSAALRLCSESGSKEVLEISEKVMGLLGLSKVADTRVGDQKVRGISGGEKKRLSLGCQLIGSPELIFCDEPTTGLDAFQAMKVMESLRVLAEEGHTVVCTLHQPRASIWKLVDDVMVLSEGSVIYSGSCEAVTDYFQTAPLSFPCEAHCNVAEFVVDLAAIDFSNEETLASSTKRVQLLVDEHRKRSSASGHLSSFVRASKEEEGEENGNGEEEEEHGVVGASASAGAGVVRRTQQGTASAFAIKSRPSSANLSARSKGRSIFTSSSPPSGTKVKRHPLLSKWRAFRILYLRSFRQVARDREANRARMTSQIFSALLFGAIYFQLGNSQSSIQDRLGLLQVSAINSAMGSLIKTIAAFARERVVIDRERGEGLYGVTEYFAGKLLAELPIAAVFPLVFSALLYPLSGLHPRTDRFLSFMGLIALESFVSSAFGLWIGSLTSSYEAAVAVAPAVMVIFIVFGGYYINPDNVPFVLRWLDNISLIRSLGGERKTRDEKRKRHEGKR